MMEAIGSWRCAIYLGTGTVFTSAMVAFAQRDADQNDRDHAQLAQAIARGDVPSAEA